MNKSHIMTKRSMIVICIFICLLMSTTLFAQNKPFPQSLNYPGCIKPNNVSQTQMNNDVESLYYDWKSYYLEASNGTTPGGGYIIRMQGTGGGGEKTTSEAHGYGMIIFALMAGSDPMAKEYFDGMFNMYKNHPSTEDPDCMAWLIHESELPQEDSSSAVDGDMDIAYALLLAHDQWGSAGTINYLAEARQLIRMGLQQSCVSPTSRRIMLGDFGEWYHGEGQYQTRTSDWMLGHLKAYNKVTGESFWLEAVDEIHSMTDTLVNQFASYTGLLPDFVVGENPQPAPADFLESIYDGEYYWNACRVPMRFAVDYAHYSDTNTRRHLAKMVNWITNVTAPSGISTGYYIGSGSPIDPPNPTAFTAPFIAACITDSQYQSYLNEGWQTIRYERQGYYNDSINLLSMLLISGNWWRPADNVTPPPTPIPPVTPVPGLNMLKNGDFSAGETNWIFKTEDTGQGSISVVNGALKATITNAGSDVWSVQVDQRELFIERGIQYKISFDAKADAARTIKFLCGMYGDPWHVYSPYLTCNLTTAWQNYSMVFDMVMFSDIEGQIEFDLGTNTSAVYLDNVVLKVNTIAPPTPTPTSTPIVTEPTPTATPTVTPTPTATSNYVNVALYKPVTASGVFSPDFPKTAVNDGNTATVWGSKYNAGPQWIFIDLQEFVDISYVSVDFFNPYYSPYYHVGVSNDAATWEFAATITNGTGGFKAIPITRRARYVGLYLTKGAKLAYGIKELGVYTTHSDPTPTPTATPIVTDPTPTPTTGIGACAGVAEWDPTTPWTDYAVGDLRTNVGNLYRCINVAYSFHEPSSPDGQYGWEFVQPCN